MILILWFYFIRLKASNTDKIAGFAMENFVTSFMGWDIAWNLNLCKDLLRISFNL